MKGLLHVTLWILIGVFSSCDQSDQESLAQNREKSINPYSGTWKNIKTGEQWEINENHITWNGFEHPYTWDQNTIRVSLFTYNTLIKSDTLRLTQQGKETIELILTK